MFFIGNILKLIKNTYKTYSKTPNLKIVEVNLSSQNVVVQLSGRKILKIGIPTLIQDSNMLNNLHPFDACWIGVIFGESLHQNKLPNSHKNKHAYFLNLNKINKYRLLFQNRGGVLGYIDTDTQEQFEDYLHTMVKSEYIMNKFGPIQASYIGMLAGIEYHTKGPRNDLLIDQILLDQKEHRFKLRLVS